MFIDETEISVSSGRGGDGVVSFRREKYVPLGGPDGGDGGKGGDVILVANRHVNTLAAIQHGRTYRAENGRPGAANQCTGRDGADLVIEVPVGTIVRDAERGHVLRDLSQDGLRCVVVAGGEGGRGNLRFAGATNQTPRHATQGGAGATRALRLELRLVADVGLVGLPNAGKSTLLRRISAARPKVADYPFTTLEPVLGIATSGDIELVVADIPGLIEGAHLGAGLGDRFLRHVARTRALLHLVDASVGAEQAVADWRVVRGELEAAGLGLAEKPVLLAASRADLCEDPQAVADALAKAAGAPCTVLSAATGLGLPALMGRMAALVAEVGKSAEEPASKP